MSGIVLIAIFAVGICLDLGGCILLLRDLGKSAREREHSGGSNPMKYMVMMTAGLACMALAVFGGYNW